MRAARRIAGPASGLLLLLLVLAAAQAMARDNSSGTSLEKVQSDLRDSRKAQQQLQREADKVARDRAEMRRRLVKMAKNIQRREDRLIAAEARLANLARNERDLAADLKKRRASLSSVLGGLARLQRGGPQLSVAGPATPIENLRASILLASIAPELERRVANLRGEIEDLRQLRAQITEERQNIDAARREMEAERREMSRLLKSKANQYEELLARAEREGRRIGALSKSAADLQELVRRLDQDRQANDGKPELEVRIRTLRPRDKPGRAKSRNGTATRPSSAIEFAGLRGQLPLPARGRVINTFGRTNGLGPASRGIEIVTRPAAQVIAPFDGEVAYAGAFRGYGQLLIIAHGQGYHTLLAGFSRIDVVVGQLLLANEPVGEMGRGESGNPKLYVELRHQGKAIDPLPWLAMNDGKVRG